MQTYITVHSHGCHYRLADSKDLPCTRLLYQPIVQGQDAPDTDEEEWGEVEQELVGDEVVDYLGETMTLREAHKDILKRLNAINLAETILRNNNLDVPSRVEWEKEIEVNTYPRERKESIVY